MENIPFIKVFKPLKADIFLKDNTNLITVLELNKNVAICIVNSDQIIFNGLGFIHQHEDFVVQIVCCF